jgi:cytochrome c-type biogenesis protein CcmF
MSFSLNAGNFMLLIAFVASVVVLIAVTLQERGYRVPFTSRLKIFPWITMGMLAAATLYLTYLFLKSDFTYMYVWSYSSRALPWYYKASAVWAGQEGTFLLWALIIYASALWASERLGFEDYLSRRVHLVTHLIGLFFLTMTLLVSPFRKIYDLYPDLPKDFIPPDGNGLNPLLQDPWMAAHPPVIFIAYGAVTIPFAAALAHLWRRDERWLSISKPWARLSWLFLTLGIALGGFWSYKVLGWGGFWAWDPVETSSLIPWFTVTALLHATVQNLRKREFPLLTPLLAVLSFFLVAYATFITRSGLWESVHAFGETTTGPYLALLLVNIPIIPAILVADYLIRKKREVSAEAKALSVAFLLAQGIMVVYKAVTQGSQLPSFEEVLVIFGLTGALFPLLRRRFSEDGEKIEETPTSESVQLFTRTNLFYLAIISLLILGFVSFWGLSYPFLMQALKDVKIKVEIDFFNTWSYPFTILLLVTIALCMGYGLMRKRSLLLGTVAILAMGAISALKGVTGKPMVDFILPVLGYAFAISVWRTTQLATSRAKPMPKAKLVGFYLIHAGVAMIIFGAIFSTSFSSQRDVVFQFIPNQGIVSERKDVGAGYAVEVAGINVYENYEGYLTSEVLVKVYKNGRYIGEGAASTINNLKFGRVTKVYINRNLDADVYVIFQGIGGHSEGKIEIPLTVKIEPLVNILWLGIALISIGILPGMIIDGFSVPWARREEEEEEEEDEEEERKRLIAEIKKIKPDWQDKGYTVEQLRDILALLREE